MAELISKQVDYNCYGSEGSPRPRDCEDASFTFIGEGNVIVGPKEPLIKQVGMKSNGILLLLQYLIWTGNCKIEVSTQQRHACTWDVLRATIDVLLGTCLDGPQAIGLGGVASARPFDAHDPANLLRRQCQCIAFKCTDNTETVMQLFNTKTSLNSEWGRLYHRHSKLRFLKRVPSHQASHQHLYAMDLSELLTRPMAALATWARS